MYEISDSFKNFIKKDCNRSDFIQNYLMNNGLETYAIVLNGKKHIYVRFPSEQYNHSTKIKTVLAHYDRVENSPGANDNSAAVFLLMQWAVKLNQQNKVHNIRLLFTDGEELSENGVQSQGAFDLGALFKRLGIVNDDIFVFDCMGRGDTPVLCSNSVPKSSTVEFKRKYIALESKIENLLNKCTDGKYMKLPSNYSDNAGFIANGIPAVAVTMLPYDEAIRYQKGINAVKNNQMEEKEKLENILPQTWKMLHTENDCFENLTPQAFEITQKILDFLAAM